jgi:hypothetical protein
MLENQSVIARLNLYQVPGEENLSVGQERRLEKLDRSEQRFASLQVVTVLLVVGPVGLLALMAAVENTGRISIVVLRSAHASDTSQGCIHTAVGADCHDE